MTDTPEDVSGTPGSDIAPIHITDEMRKSSVFLLPRVDPSPTKPQLNVRIDRARAADLRVPVSAIATTLESLLGGRRVTQFQRGNQQYYVIVQVEDADRSTPTDLSRLYVKSTDGNLVQLSNLVTAEETVVPENFPHFNRMRSADTSHRIEQVGAELRRMMPFVNPKEVVPGQGGA